MTHTSTDAPVRYDAVCDIYRRAGIARVTFDELAAGPWCPRPDIYIGLQPGWEPDRATRWLKETGRIDVYGRPARADRLGRPRRDEEPPSWYHVTPKRYLTAGDAARVLNRERKIIGRMKAAGHGPKAAVILPSLRLVGYGIDEVVRLGEQYGWVAEGGAEARKRWRELCGHRDQALKSRRKAKGDPAACPSTVPGT